ncbi:hypothetical protein FDP41_003401 [Naegleria fowleri]|uniref:Uncharacterized protein n=1 Tax=Naegleria fowleri TaxID=5763 RepID=A0A6A5BWW7_NAEFO|nr:uncharacterized protein FDP41_003401 [Naegleria fowleri]KAF0977409.1 hypothetical protein FDP41_003401 [Naegleria fowleri]CAG4718406.1 unnamed protein product [Naegleria fowleri]
MSKKQQAESATRAATPPNLSYDMPKRNIWRDIRHHLHRNMLPYLIASPFAVWIFSNYWIRGSRKNEKVISAPNVLTWKRECEKIGQKKIDALGIDLKSELEKNIPVREEVVSLYPIAHGQNNASSYSMSKEEQLKFVEELFPDLVAKFKSQRGILN